MKINKTTHAAIALAVCILVAIVCADWSYVGFIDANAYPGSTWRSYLMPWSWACFSTGFALLSIVVAILLRRLARLTPRECF